MALGCVPTPPAPGAVSLERRLSVFPTTDHELAGRVEVLFDEHAIPFIIAEHENDVPYAMGLIHAHLREGQLELLRLLSQGRLSEIVGPLATDIDVVIRTLDLDRAVPRMSRELPPETRRWIERYVSGLNAYMARRTVSPLDRKLLGAERVEPWTVHDVLTIGRLASADLNWGRWFTLGRLRNEPGWAEFSERLDGYAASGRSSFGGETPTPLDPIFDASKAGSNSFVVSGQRSASGAGLIASDPHLGVQQPNLLCLVGYRSPESAVVGLTFPGLPFVVIGRNERIAWGGTNMQGVSSALYDVSEIPESSMRTRRERIERRFWFAANVKVRETPVGPLVSEMPFFEDVGFAGSAALWWRGHQPSDEASTFLRVSKASTWDEFRAAFSTYAVGGQNFLYADVEGNIGQLMAIEYVPGASRATALNQPAPMTDPAFGVELRIGSDELPAAYNPSDGFLVSSNNTPIKLDPPVTLSGNQNDRVLRLRQLLERDGEVTVGDLMSHQRDVRSLSSERAALAITDELGETSLKVVDGIRGWDGSYRPNATAPVAYQRLLDRLIDAHYTERYGDRIADFLRSSTAVHHFVAEDVGSGAIDREALLAAAERAESGYDRSRTWGDVHRLRLAHPASRLPLIGDRFVFDEAGVGGSTGTVLKSAHGVAGGAHRVRFGAQSRHVSDLSDLDENFFVLLGGQDGWFGSANQLDQWPLFKRGEYVRVPLREKTVREAFAVERLELSGASPAE